jgi:hypothetical protein
MELGRVLSHLDLGHRQPGMARAHSTGTGTAGGTGYDGSSWY